MRAIASLVVASAVSLAVGCGGGDGGNSSSDKPPGAPGAGPSAGDPGASADGGAAGNKGPNGNASIDLSGSYELSSRFDLTTAGILPNMANDTLRALSDLKTNPAKTIIELLQAMHVPIVSTVLGVIPDALTSYFEGWFNDYVFGALYQNAPVTQQLAGLVSDIGNTATQFEVVSRLDLPKIGSDGNVTAKHALSGIAFTILGQRTLIATPSLLAPFTTADHVSVNAVHILEQSPQVENGRLAAGDHHFGVPLGDYLIEGIDRLVQAKLQAKDLRTALGNVIDCASIAQSVAGECLAGECVGHEAEIEQMCNAGLDEIIQDVDDKLRSLNIDALHLASGQARMWDAKTPGGDLDGKIDRIDDGEWSALMLVPAGGEHPVAAKFTGTRVGDAPASPAPSAPTN